MYMLQNSANLSKNFTHSTSVCAHTQMAPSCSQLSLCGRLSSFSQSHVCLSSSGSSSVTSVPLPTMPNYSRRTQCLKLLQVCLLGCYSSTPQCVLYTLLMAQPFMYVHSLFYTIIINLIHPAVGCWSLCPRQCNKI